MEVLLRRVRTCFNGHRFQTYEVFPGNLDQQNLSRTKRGIQIRSKAWTRKAKVLAHPEMSNKELGKELGITEASVRRIRRWNKNT